MSMKSIMAGVMAVLFIAASAWGAEMETAKSEDVTITGKISCTDCVLPGLMECSKECCTACIKSGDPVLLSDSSGNLYILLNTDKSKPLMTEERMSLIRENVKVQGMLVKRGGVQAIYVKSMEKAK